MADGNLRSAHSETGQGPGHIAHRSWSATPLITESRHAIQRRAPGLAHALSAATAAFTASRAQVVESERTRQRLQVNLGELAQRHQHRRAPQAACVAFSIVRAKPSNNGGNKLTATPPGSEDLLSRQRSLPHRVTTPRGETLCDKTAGGSRNIDRQLRRDQACRR